MKQSYKTWCPLFPGFYGTIYEPDETSEIESYNDEYKTDLNYDDFNFDYDQYYKDLSTEYVNKLEVEINSNILPVKMTFEAVQSPREYNFTNYSINIDLEIDLDELINIISNNKDKAAEYFKDKYTSCSGFISFHSNDIEDWLNIEYINEKPAHRIGALLECACYVNGISDDEMMYINANLDIWPKETVKS